MECQTEMVRCLECGLIAHKGVAGLCTECSRGVEWDEDDDFGGLSIDSIPASTEREDEGGFFCLGDKGFQWVNTPPLPRGRS